ncbi:MULTISPECIES: DUF5819 family protein [unclassified Streptomyces]|uniref:DUF5819 family protein n=1 Tax=Streptomyces sp. NPDC055082 TaxID=3365718 RepID=UPI0037CFEF33
MVIDGERGGMDSDHGGRSDSEEKDAWPQVVSHSNTEPHTSAPASPPASADASPPASAYAGQRPSAHAEQSFPAAGRPHLTSGTSTDAQPHSGPGAAGGAAGSGDRATGGGIAALSFGYQAVAAVALSVIGMIACAQVAMVFLHVAPSNTLTKQHGEAVDNWVYPEFEQNWKLFAPNPLQQNIAVHVRAEVVGADGRRTTPWMSLSGEDGKEIRGNLFPSHVHQNELRRGWDFFVNSHDSENRPNGLRGDLSERYIRRIVMLRLGAHDYGGTVERIQVRSETRSVTPPPWSEEKISTRPNYRVLPWWTVAPEDLPENAGAPQASRGEEADK